MGNVVQTLRTVIRGLNSPYKTVERGDHNNQIQDHSPQCSCDVAEASQPGLSHDHTDHLGTRGQISSTPQFLPPMRFLNNLTTSTPAIDEIEKVFTKSWRSKLKSAAPYSHYTQCWWYTVKHTTMSGWIEALNCFHNYHWESVCGPERI